MVYLLKQLFLPVFVALNSVLAYRCLFSEDDAVRDILDTWSPGRVLTEEPLSDFERHMLHVMGAACLCFLLTELTAIYLDDARYQFCTLFFQTLFFAVDGYSYLKMGKEMAETPLAQAIGLGILGLGLHGLSIDLFGIEDVDTGAATGTPSSVQVGTHTNTTTATATITKLQNKKKNQKSSDKTTLVNGITSTRPNGTTSTMSSGRTSDNTNSVNYNHKDSSMDEEGDIDPEIRQMFAATSAALDAATAELVNGAGAEKSKNSKKKNKKKNGITGVVDGSSSDSGTSSNGHTTTTTTTTTTDRKFPPPSAAAAAAFLQEKRETDTIRMVHMNSSSSMPIDGKDVPALIEDSE
jgi:hypothetical protein